MSRARREVVHTCEAVYKTIPASTTSGGHLGVPSAANVTTFVDGGLYFRSLAGWQPICGAKMRPRSNQRRADDGPKCKRCLAVLKKRDRRKRDLGPQARGKP